MQYSKRFATFISVFFALVWSTSKSLDAYDTGSSFSMKTSEPILVENTLLPPGVYEWRRFDSPANRNIVQIRNENTHRVQATIIAIAKYRNVATVGNHLDFWETPNGAPKAVRTWFAPGDNFGDEFPYPTMWARYQPKSAAPATALQNRAEAVEPGGHKFQVSAPKRVSNTPDTNTPEGSWAVITNGATSPKPAMPTSKPHQRGTIWDALRGLPLTATIAPLMGLIGAGCLVMFLLSHARRKRRFASVDTQ